MEFSLGTWEFPRMEPEKIFPIFQDPGNFQAQQNAPSEADASILGEGSWQAASPSIVSAASAATFARFGAPYFFANQRGSAYLPSASHVI